MKNKFLFILPIALLFFGIISFAKGAVYNQPVTGNSSSSSGGIASGTVLNLGSPLIVGNPASSTAATISGGASSSLLSYLNNVGYLNPGFATVGCFGSSTTTDAGACANLFYAQSVAAGFHGAEFHINFAVPSANFQTGISFSSNSGVAGTLDCPVGTILTWGGGGAALTINSSNSHTFGQGGDGCTIQGTTSAGATSTQIGVVLGGVNNAEGTDLTDMTFKNLNLGLTFTNNTWSTYVENTTFNNNQKNVLIPAGLNNFGEALVFNKDTFAQDSAPNYIASGTVNCFENDFLGYLEVSFYGGSFDNCQFSELASTSTPKQQTFNFYGTWFENPGGSVSFGYDYLNIATSTRTNVNLYSAPFLDDETTASSAAEFATDDANMSIYTGSASGFAAVTNLVKMGTAATLNVANFSVQNTTVLNITGGSGGVVENLIDDGSGSGPVWEQSSNGIADGVNEIILSKSPGNAVNSIINEDSGGNLNILNNFPAAMNFGVNGSTIFSLKIGHIGFATSSVTSNCGTVNGSDNGGAVTFTQASTTCTINFATTWNFVPVCTMTVASSSSNIIRNQLISTSSDRFGDTTAFPTTTIVDYICQGNPS